MLAGLVVGIILGVIAACILIVATYRYFYLQRQRKTTQIFYVPPATATRSLSSYHYSGPRTPEMRGNALSAIPYAYQSVSSGIAAPVLPETEPHTPLSDMFSPYTDFTIPFSELAGPVIRKAAIRTPHVSEQPRTMRSRAATELRMEQSPSPVSPLSSRAFSPATFASARESICDTPVIGTALVFNVSRDSLPRFSTIRIDNEEPSGLSPPRSAYIPYKPPQG